MTELIVSTPSDIVFSGDVLADIPDIPEVEVLCVDATTTVVGMDDAIDP